MGKMFAKLFGKKDMRILMLGLDAAGKTSILLFAFSPMRSHHCNTSTCSLWLVVALLVQSAVFMWVVSMRCLYMNTS